MAAACSNSSSKKSLKFGKGQLYLFLFHKECWIFWVKYKIFVSGPKYLLFFSSSLVSCVLRCKFTNTYMCAANSITPTCVSNWYITYIIHFIYHFVCSITPVVQSIVTYESSSCQPVLIVFPIDSKTLIGRKSVYSVWSSQIKPNPCWCLCKYVDFIQPEPKLTSQTTEPISIFSPRSVTEDHWTIEALLNYCPALYRCLLVAVDWEGFVTARWFYIVYSAYPISCVEKLLAVGVQDCGRK